MLRERAEAEAWRSVPPPAPRDDDGTGCVDCGEEIPLARRDVFKRNGGKGPARCVDCQDAIERRAA